MASRRFPLFTKAIAMIAVLIALMLALQAVSGIVAEREGRLREAERSVTRPPGLETLRQYSVQCVKARTHPQPDNVSRKRIDFGVAHDAVGKLGVATVPGVELAETATQPLLGIGNPTQGARR